MIKSLIVVVFLIGLTMHQSVVITPDYILPESTAKGEATTFSLRFGLSEGVPSNARLLVTFPAEFSPNALTEITRVRWATADSTLEAADWSLSLRTIELKIGKLEAGNITVAIQNVRNPSDYSTSSYFTVGVLFQDVSVVSDNDFGRVSFTPVPTITSGALVKNFENRYIEQGSSWTFEFTLSKAYPQNHSLRFAFPEGFNSKKVQCEVSGIVDRTMEARVLPNKHIFDCLNLKQSLPDTKIQVVISGVVNPDYEMTASGFKIVVLEPNNVIPVEEVTSTSSIMIKNKPFKARVKIPNNYRNNTLSYIFQINPYSTLEQGSRLELTFASTNWTILTQFARIISGVESLPGSEPLWTASSDTANSLTRLTLTNYASIPRTRRLTFYLPVRTPINPGSYELTIKSYRQNGGLAQSYSEDIVINQTTGYIREMKLHPMQRAIKLPVGQTGPLELVLFLRSDLPKTNVLTYGKIVMDIFPNIPAPLVDPNGVPKCYFYKDIPAKNCTFDSASDSLKTTVTIFTPVDFNFQESEVPLTITTEGFKTATDQGITIDTLVKRYFFEIQFYTHLRPEPIPQEVIFDEWIPDSIPISSLSCDPINRNYYQYDHIKCSFTTPKQVLNSNGHIHFFRVEFSYATWNGWEGASNLITPDYPCLMYGPNVKADPYVKCDYVTWQSGPYESSQSSTSYNYMTFYGLETIPGGSLINFEIPRIYRTCCSSYRTYIKLSILEDTPGFSSPIVYIYTQQVDIGPNSGTFGSPSWTTPTNSFGNPVINKVSDFTLSSYWLPSAGITEIILELEQTAFPNIGRGSEIACGAHKCSKFDKPIQYFILYPSTSLTTTETLVFPDILTPPYAGSFRFDIRGFKNQGTQFRRYFNVEVNPDTITTASYTFSSQETITTLFPNADHLYNISWTTVNPIVISGGNAYILINIDNVFTLSSTYCHLTTTASSLDGRGIFCEMTAGGTSVRLKNLADVPAGSTFSVILQMRSTAITSSVSPTVDIRTYYGNGNEVDQVLNLAFSSSPITNSNLTVLHTFSVPDQFTSKRQITAGYFGHLLVSFQPQLSSTVINGSQIILTMATGWYPAGNSLGLPLSCKLNNVRVQCSYTLSPFTITLFDTETDFSTSNNVINITTEYQNANGIHYPTTQGRYQLQLQIKNASSGETQEIVQQYVDILPPEVAEFKVDWAHRDINRYNIFTVELKNGATAIPAYDDGANQGRIYIGFPVRDDSNNPVFADDLGFSGIAQGELVPCHFETGAGYATPNSGKALECRIRKSTMTQYHTWVEVINFNSIAAGERVKIYMAKITNPGSKQIDINFKVKVNSMAVSSKQESSLYETKYNMFINMLSPSTANRNEANASTVMFDPMASVGDQNKYFTITPESASTWSQNDWWVLDLDPQFPLNGNINNCLTPFFAKCIVYPTINWVAVNIGNGTILTLRPYVSKLPLSISRVDTTFQTYNFKSGRWAQTYTNTITAASRWMELRGAVSQFSFEVVGSQNRINVGQKDVQVMVGFTVQHKVPVGGTIEIQFPNNASAVPAIKPHCRSAVSMGSALMGYDTDKPANNVQGEIGCTVQNSYSWLITGFGQLDAGSQVKIFGKIDFPTVATNTLGMGWVATYEDQHASNAFDHARTIDYLSTNFPLSVANLTWNVDPALSKVKTAPLRVNHVGEMRFLLKLSRQLNYYAGGGYIYINLWHKSTTGQNGGFNGPTSQLVCTLVRLDTMYKYGCEVAHYASPGDYTGYKVTSFHNIPAGVNLELVLTTQKGSGTEGINFPTSQGIYKTEIEIEYYTNSPYDQNQATHVEVYGPDFSILEFNSTVTIPGENNFIMVIFRPSANIATTSQFIIEIPTVSLDGQALFPVDLGMGYSDYDDLVFDLFESSISSMTCKVYTGDTVSSSPQPVKIVCSDFSSTIQTSHTVKFGFWVVNPSTVKGQAIPVQVYAYDQRYDRKYVWSMVEAGIRLLPVDTTPTSDDGNWVASTHQREQDKQNLDFTTRNNRVMVKDDWYILKFNLPLRNSANINDYFYYNSDLSGRGDVIFMENCRTVLLRVGANDLAIAGSGSTSINARIRSQFYTPPYKLNAEEQSVTAFAIYNSADSCEKIIYSDALLPYLQPQEPYGVVWSVLQVYSNRQRGQRDDFRFTFRMASDSENSTAMVKLIGIEFPPTQDSDIQLVGEGCYEYAASDIEVEHCIIDKAGRTIWVTPHIKDYKNNDYLVIETLGKAIQNPKSQNSFDIDLFTIRYYTWPDSMSRPVIAAGNEDWCFMKQDSTWLPSSNLVFNAYYSGYRTPHTFLSIPEKVVVNEWEPAHYFIGNSSHSQKEKSSFNFKLITPNSFNSLESTSHYHYIQVYYNTYYSVPAVNQRNNDLYYYVPHCELDGFVIHKCELTSGWVKMSFQHYLGNGQEISVRMTIVNPYDEDDEGFTLKNTNTGTITMPIQVYSYGRGTYYGEQEPFHPFYEATSSGASYPSQGIEDVTMTWGTHAQGQLNYIEFSIKLTRSDVNGLVLEIPVYGEDGQTKIYNTPSLLGLDSGSKYPCSLGVDVKVYCSYEQGSHTGYGTPIRINIVNFNVPSNRVIPLRILLTNSDISDVFPRFIFKAFGGDHNAPKMMGHEFMGVFQVKQKLKIYPSAQYHSTGTANMYPTKTLWQTGNAYEIWVSHQNQNANSYYILKWPLTDPTYGTFGDYDESNSYDRFFVQEAEDKMFVYIVRKLTSDYVASWQSYYSFQYLRMKHYMVKDFDMYLLGRPWSKRYTATISSSWQSSLASDGLGTFAIDAIDVQSKYNGDWSWHFASINTANAHNIALKTDDPSTMVIEVKMSWGRTWSELSPTSTECNLESGVIGNDPLNPIYCVLDRNNGRLLIYNVYSLTNEHLKFYYKARAASSQNDFDVQVRGYTNVQAFSDYNWPLFRSTTNSNYDLINNVFYAARSYDNRNNPGNDYSNLDPGDGTYEYYTDMVPVAYTDRSGGYAQIISLSSNTIKVRMRLYQERDFSTETYRMGFRFYLERLSFSGSCSSVTLWNSRYGTASSKGWGTHTTWTRSCGSASRRIYVAWTFYRNSYPQDHWPKWYAGDYTDITFQFGSIGHHRSANPNYLHATATLVWENTRWYTQDQSKCNCCNTCCETYCRRQTCWGGFSGFGGLVCRSTTSSSCCKYKCCTACSCRWYRSWSSVAVTGRSNVWYSTPVVNTIASSTSIGFSSNQYGAEVEMWTYISGLRQGITSSMTSKTNQGSHAQLVVTFTGNQNFPNNNPFKYTSNTEAAARVDCMCYVGSSNPSNWYSAPYKNAQCTRYIQTGFPPHMTIRVDAPAGSVMLCSWPGMVMPSSSGGSSLYANYYWDDMNYFKRNAIPEQFRSTYQTTGVHRALTSQAVQSFNSVDYLFDGYNQGSGGQVNEARSYRIRTVSRYNRAKSAFYLSAIHPKTSQSMCNSSAYFVCRAYTTFYTRRYYLVTMHTPTSTTFDITASLTFPQSRQASSSYYGIYIGYGEGDWSDYDHTWTGSYSPSKLHEATPDKGWIPSVYSNYFQQTKSSMSVSVDLDGYTLYSNRRTTGGFKNSFLRLTMSGFTSLNGCGAAQWDNPNPAWDDNALYCTVKSSTVIEVRSNKDLAFDGYLDITFSTDSVPSTTATYTLQLFDRYHSSSDYGMTVEVSGTFSKQTSHNVLQPTSINWRRQTYKQLRSSDGPIKFTMHNQNYDYVSTYSMNSHVESSSSDALLVYMPGADLPSSVEYVCLAREYEEDKPTLYREFFINCDYHTSSQIRIQSVAGHILKSTFYYDFIIYRNAGASSSLIAFPSADTTIVQIGTTNKYSSGTLQYYDYLAMSRYRSTSPITLHSIYILTREAAALNSLFVNFEISISQSDSQVHYWQFQFDQLDLGYFGISNGDEIPCYLGGVFATQAGKTNEPKCFGWADGVGKTSPLLIRVHNFNGWSSGQDFKIAFDNFNNPPKQALFAVPIDMTIRLYDRSTNDIYVRTFNRIFFSDSDNTVVPGQLGGNILRTNNARGATNAHYMNRNWPYSSSNSDISEKLVVKIQGGITATQSFSSLTFRDSQTTYTNLWTNTRANMSVYRTPSKSYNTNTNWTIQNVINPQQVDKEEYQKVATVTFIMYNDYKTAYITTLGQPAFSTYTKATDFGLTGDPGAVNNPAHFKSHSGYPITLEFSFDVKASSYSNRGISHLTLEFTHGVSRLETAWFRYSPSPYFINKNGFAKVGYNTQNSRWFVNITGIADSNVHASYHWYLRIRMYASGHSDRVYYTSNVYNRDGELEFTGTNSNNYLPNDGWSSSSNIGTPSTWVLQHQRYVPRYYQLARTPLYAKSGLTTNKLFFKFTAPYTMEADQDLEFHSSSTSFPKPASNSAGLYCILQQTQTNLSSYGEGLYSECSYGSNGVFSLKVPKGGLQKEEYLLTIVGRDQLSSSFSLPTSPQRIEVSLIYKNKVNVHYGDVYTLDFAGMMTTYDVQNLHTYSGNYNMLGFRFRPGFVLPSASTSVPITESVLSFEFDSNYYDDCLGIQNIFSSDGMTFYNGAYFSHDSEPAVGNANTRILCGQNTQPQNWAPAKLSVTDYGALSTGTTYYFRFPLITLPSVVNTPLIYKVKLLHYANGVPYPTILSQYSYENLVQTASGSHSNQGASLVLSNDDVQKTMSVTFRYTSYWINTAGEETLIKFKNNALDALESLATLPTLSTSYFSYQYYPNINLCLYKKTHNNTVKDLSLGTYPTADQTENFKLQWVYTFEGNARRTAWFPSNTATASYNLNYATSWTSSSFTKGSNLLNTNVMDLYTVSWSANYLSFPEGSYMILTFTDHFELIDEYCHAMSGFVQGSDPKSNLVCKRSASNKITIDGYSTLSVGASLQIKLYMQLADKTVDTSYSSTVNIAVYSQDAKLIINANTIAYILNLASTGSASVGLESTMIEPYTLDDSFPLYINFRLRSNSLVNGDYLEVDFGNWILGGSSDLAHPLPTFKYQIAGNIYWVPSMASHISGNKFKVPVYENYSLSSGIDITLWVDTHAPTLYYGSKPSAIQWNTFSIFAYKSGGTLVEQEVKKIWTEPYGHPSFTATLALTYTNAQSLWEFEVTPNVSAKAGDSILIEFTTDDGLYEPLFANDLGASSTYGSAIDGTNSGFFDCNEFYNTHVISDSQIHCRVHSGDNTANPPIPTTIRIPITKAISANTAIKFNILGIKNPSRSGWDIGVTFKLADSCDSNDQVNLCAYYKSVTYLRFNSVPSMPGWGTTGSLSFNPKRISATNTVHTVSVGYSLNSGSFVKLNYYSQIPIPAVCALSSNNGECYSYPTSNIIIIKSNATFASTYTFSLSGMDNPYQNFYGTNTFSTQLWQGGSVYRRFYTNYAAQVITTDPTSSDPLSITFEPTLTPNYQLKYGFWNIAKIKITHLLQNQHIQRIRIDRPSEVTLDTEYCNITMESTAAQAQPYPVRFICQDKWSHRFNIIFQSDFPTWKSEFTQRDIFIYLRYTISNSKTGNSNNWNVYTYSALTDSSYYMISHAQGNFPITEFQTPYLYVLNFPTKSFNTRTCTLEQKCMFYGFIYPSTPSSTIGINRMTYILPRQFRYEPQRSFDSCTVQSRTTDLRTFSCGLERQRSRVTIDYMPPSYNQEYNLINIDHSSESSLFTSPKYPGNHYQMKVNLWSSANTLVESQFINITTVFGYYLEVPKIVAAIPLDGGNKGLLDLQFEVGTSDILPSYENSADNKITSAIELIFSNKFEKSLGTNKAAGDEIACLAVSGLTFNTVGRIKCQIYPSESTITYPTLIVTGYDRILAGTVVRIRFADLQTLETGVEDFCELGVSYTYFNYGGTKGYIYEPVSFVVGPPTAPVTPKAITFTVSETSSSYVGQLSDYSISGTIESGFAPVKTTDFIVVQFPQHSFEGRFNQNSQALCSIATGSMCSVFGLASQIYIQPSSTISSTSLSFTIQKLLNAAFEIEYVDQQVVVFTVVDNKINANGSATFLKFTRPSPNITGIILSTGSIYGGDAGIDYSFEFILNSYLPEYGKVSVVFPDIYTSLTEIGSVCTLRNDSQELMGSQAYCQIINSHQLVIVPNGGLLQQKQPYYFTVKSITNPNLDASAYHFAIESYYFGNVYENRRKVISNSKFSGPIITPLTVKDCQLEVQLSTYNVDIDSRYQFSLVCPGAIKVASELKLYLSWNPPVSKGKCTSDAQTLYSSECNVKTEFQQSTKRTYLSVFLRAITAQKLVTVVGRIPNGDQGTYQIEASISYNKFTYLKAVSNEFYITTSSSASSGLSGTGSGASSTSANGNTMSVQSRNYPLNRAFSSIYTFALTNPGVEVDQLEVVLPDKIETDEKGVTCGHQSYQRNYNYFELLIKEQTNSLVCSSNAQSITISGIKNLLAGLTTNSFLFLTLNGLVNPDTSVSQSNFSFNFINTTSTNPQSVAYYTLPLSYSVSRPPTDIQINSISLESEKYYVNTNYTFDLATVGSSQVTIVADTRMGISVKFPPAYTEIWEQITAPSSVVMTINSVEYTSANVTLTTGYLFAVFADNAFPSQVQLSALQVKFEFRNPDSAIDCTQTPVYVVSLFDFKGNSVFAQTLSNNQVCPTLDDRHYSIEVSGNTKISAGSSQEFTIKLEEGASELSITPACQSNAISFSPSTITFTDYSTTTATFTISAATSLTGSFRVTFSKTEGTQTFYNDIEFLTLEVYQPTSQYKISIGTFEEKSIGNYISSPITLEEASPSEFALTYTHDCDSNFDFEPASRIPIAKQAVNTTFAVRYTGNTVPPVCSINFQISSLTTSPFVLQTSTVYLISSVSLSRTRSDTHSQRYMLLELSHTKKTSNDVGKDILQKDDSTTTDSTGTATVNLEPPTIYKLVQRTIGSNYASYRAVTSTTGKLYFVVVASGTPQSSITSKDIYERSVTDAVTYGSMEIKREQNGVNIKSNFNIDSLEAQSEYMIAIYLNSTIGISEIVFEEFDTAKASNGAVIKLAFERQVRSLADLRKYLSYVLRIRKSRIFVQTYQQVQVDLNNSFKSAVMNDRRFIYEVAIAPDTHKDINRPIDLCTRFRDSKWMKLRLRNTFLSDFVVSYRNPTWQILMVKPRVRQQSRALEISHKHVKVGIDFWDQAQVYGVVVEQPSSRLRSRQVIRGLDESNQKVVAQHYQQVLSGSNGYAQLSFTALSQDTEYLVCVSAESVISFRPRLKLKNRQVSCVGFRTKVDLNRKDRQDEAVRVVESDDPELARVIELQKIQTDKKKNIVGGSSGANRRN